ncbi:3400_t:CDS:2 [Ambispora gerdemannii]|uniref:3400_t:CDS:1 n=1 Tax=Ambispora gerdemannii TaxID=144530 RepID=A0A9N8VCS7_9GLOM|nr:3400_t:CDS:2 [Ambispora gerdemannii]
MKFSFQRYIKKKLNSKKYFGEQRQQKELRNAVKALLLILQDGHKRTINDLKILDQMQTWLEKRNEFDPKLIFDQLCSMYHENHLKYSLLIAFFYYWRIGTETDRKRAFEIYQRAAKYAAATGDLESQVTLALQYVGGNGVRKNTAKGFYWMKQAAEGGSISAQIKVAEYYQDGVGTSGADKRRISS